MVDNSYSLLIHNLSILLLTAYNSSIPVGEISSQTLCHILLGCWNQVLNTGHHHNSHYLPSLFLFDARAAERIWPFFEWCKLFLSSFFRLKNCTHWLNLAVGLDHHSFRLTGPNFLRDLGIRYLLNVARPWWLSILVFQYCMWSLMSN